MNEVTKEGYSAIEQALRDEVIPPRVEPKRFERRDTVELPALSDVERAVRERIDAKLAAGHAHSPIPLPPDEPPTVDQVLEQRNTIHGDFTEDATTAQDLKAVMRRGRNWEDMPPWMKEALEQMQTKVARILSGDFTHLDHWKDLQGYPRLVETRLDK